MKRCFAVPDQRYNGWQYVFHAATTREGDPTNNEQMKATTISAKSQIVQSEVVCADCMIERHSLFEANYSSNCS
ncbi:MAG: hypothetical protein ACI9R3_005026 [Verrucomicrobiales bacterium]|jgi:hypothetical protein